jgi:uncharacterized protein (DUF2141 family)
MNIKKIILVILFLSTILISSDNYLVKVEVDYLRNDKGDVQFSIYNRDGTIPDKKFKNFYKQQRAQIIDGKAYTIFKDLPIGRYAINILHDENKNKKIDKGFLLPTEGIGFSNYDSIGIGNKPNFKKASFLLDKDMQKSIKIIYF